jgi:hypothetical protein
MRFTYFLFVSLAGCRSQLRNKEFYDLCCLPDFRGALKKEEVEIGESYLACVKEFKLMQGFGWKA